jgi:hypothetical protein
VLAQLDEDGDGKLTLSEALGLMDGMPLRSGQSARPVGDLSAAVAAANAVLDAARKVRGSTRTVPSRAS